MRGGAFFNGKEGRDDFRTPFLKGKEGRVDFRKRLDDFRNQNSFSVNHQYSVPTI